MRIIKDNIAKDEKYGSLDICGSIGDFYYLCDGATPPPFLNIYKNIDSRAFQNRLERSIEKNCLNKSEHSTQLITALVIEDVVENIPETDPPYFIPSSTYIMAKLTRAGLHFSLVGDSELIVLGQNGSYQTLTDTRLERSAIEERERFINATDENRDEFHQALVLKEQSFLNTRGGFFEMSARKLDISELVEGFVPNPQKVLLASDGFMRGLREYGIYSDEEELFQDIESNHNIVLEKLIHYELVHDIKPDDKSFIYVDPNA